MEGEEEGEGVGEGEGEEDLYEGSRPVSACRGRETTSRPKTPGQKRRRREKEFGVVREAVEDGLWRAAWDGGRTSVEARSRLILELESAGRDISSPAPPPRPSVDATNGGDAAAGAAGSAEGAEEFGEPDPDGDEQTEQGQHEDGSGDHDDFIVDDEDVADELPRDADEPEPVEGPAPAGTIDAERASIRQRVGETVVVGGVTWTVVEEVETDTSSIDGELMPGGSQTSSSFLSSESLNLDEGVDADDLHSMDAAVEKDAFVQLLWSDVSAMVTAVNVAGAKGAKPTARFKKTTQREFGVFLGLTIGAVAFVEKGRELWRPKFPELANRQHYEQYMSETRFNELRK